MTSFLRVIYLHLNFRAPTPGRDKGCSTDFTNSSLYRIKPREKREALGPGWDQISRKLDIFGLLFCYYAGDICGLSWGEFDGEPVLVYSSPGSISIGHCRRRFETNVNEDSGRAATRKLFCAVHCRLFQFEGCFLM